MAGPSQFIDDFDVLRGRSGTKWNRFGPDVVPSWIADMDVSPCPEIQKSIYDVVGKGGYGYPADDLNDRLVAAFTQRMATKFGWLPPTEQTRTITEVVQGVNAAIHCFTEPGGGVVVFTPSYPPFLSDIEGMGRRLVAQPLTRTASGWEFDADSLEANAADSSMILLVNPHNPTGKVFTRSELETIVAIADRHDIVIVSDEIHQDFVWDGTHIPTATIEGAAERTATFTSATKAFNLAGLRCAFGHFGDDLIDRWDSLYVAILGSVSTIGAVATIAAWSGGEQWQTDVLGELKERRKTLTSFMADTLPQVGYLEPAATYLGWLDLQYLGLENPAEWLEENAGVALGHGPDFGEAGKGHCRLNFATGAGVLEVVLNRLAAGHETLTNLPH